MKKIKEGDDEEENEEEDDAKEVNYDYVAIEMLKIVKYDKRKHLLAKQYVDKAIIGDIAQDKAVLEMINEVETTAPNIARLIKA